MAHPDRLTSEVPLKDIATLWARRLGVECFPVTGKKPTLGYHWHEKALTKPGVHQVEDKAWLQATGFAVAPIAGDTLVIIDCDEPTFAAQLLSDIPSLQTALTVWHGQHCHIYTHLTKPLPRATISIKNGNGEVAGLRGPGSYVVGPYSTHPDGEIYKPQGNLPVRLDENETEQLLQIFGLPVWRNTRQSEGQPEDTEGVDQRFSDIRLRAINPKVIEKLTQYYEKQGFRKNGQWLNGPCPKSQSHKHGDRHPSFGFNTQSGVGHCFLCGYIPTRELCRLANISLLGLGFYAGASEAVIPQEEPETINQKRRLELISAGFTRAVRLLDMLRTEKNSQYTWQQLLTLGSKVGWSRATVDRNINQAQEAGLLKRTRRGLYERLEKFTTPAPAQPFGPAYREHPAQYRRVMYKHVLRYLQPKPPSAAWPSTQRLANTMSLSRQTIYRYEARLGIKRLRVEIRSILPEEENSPAVPDEVVHTFLGWRKAYYRFEVVLPRGDTIARFEVSDNPAQALSDALAHARQWGGAVLLAKSMPSIRILPGQSMFNLVPASARLSSDYTHVLIDPPLSQQFDGKFGFPVPLPKKEGTAAFAGAKASKGHAHGGSRAPHISSLNNKSEKKPIFTIGQAFEKLTRYIEKRRLKRIRQGLQPP